MNLLKSYLPDYINDEEICAIEDAIGTVIGKCWEAWDSLKAQANPQTATWGLDKWEERVGVTLSPALDSDLRRSKIIAKLRSRRTATTELIKSVAESYSNGDVEVIENFDTSEIIIHFCGQYGIPQWLDAIKADIETIIPAHLSVSYEKDYLLISEVSVMTVAEIGTKPLSHFAGGGAA